MITYINIDTILSDPLLLTATILVVVGPLMFLVALWNLVRSPKKKDPLFDPKAIHDDEPVLNSGKKVLPVAAPMASPVAPPPAPAQDARQMIDIPQAPPEPMDMDKTIVMPAGMAEIQGQLEIAFSQIKHLNKKVFELEKAIPVGGVTNGESASSIGNEQPGNISDLAQKLLKLAEHVILLEKNVNKLMHANKSSLVPSETPQVKPPIMPL